MGKMETLHYHGLETKESTSKYSVKQRAKIGIILHKLNNALLDNGLLHESGPYTHKDINKLLRKISQDSESSDIDNLISILDKQLSEIDYLLPKKL